METSNEKKKIFAHANELTSQQRAKLKGMAHALKPVIQIGDDGFSETVQKELLNALNTHELIKIQLPGQSDAASKKNLTAELEKVVPKHSHVVGRVGRIVVLYMEKDPSKAPKIPLKSLK